MSDQLPLAERTIGDYLQTLGSSRPAPGGGSVAGLVGALAAGLGQMVVSLTAKHGEDPNLEGHYSLLGSSIVSLLSSAAADERAYSGYLEASRLPRSTGDEKAARRNAMQTALIHAAEVPLGLASSACDLLDQLAPVVSHGTPHALSDADIAISLAHASVVAGLANVRINIPLIKNETKAAGFTRQSDDLETRANARAESLRSALKARRAT
jgi:formiminotetrahydrofolate cyclodeaminase